MGDLIPLGLRVRQGPKPTVGSAANLPVNSGAEGQVKPRRRCFAGASACTAADMAHKHGSNLRQMKCMR